MILKSISRYLWADERGTWLDVLRFLLDRKLTSKTIMTPDCVSGGELVCGYPHRVLRRSDGARDLWLITDGYCKLHGFRGRTLRHGKQI